MKITIPVASKLFSIAVGLLLANSASAYTGYVWDPQTNNAQNPYLGDMSGSWEASLWSTDSTGQGGQASPSPWTEGKAALFGVNTGIGTPAYTVTMNANHTVAGIFDGPLVPNSCDITIAGTGILTLPSGLQGFDIINASDGSLGLLRVNVVIAGAGAVTAEGNGQIYLRATNTYSGGTSLGYSGASWTGIMNFSNSFAFGTGPIWVARIGSALVCEATNALRITNSVVCTNNINIVGNPAGVTFSGPWSVGAFTPVVGSGNADDNVITISGVISGTGGFKKDHTGNLILSATNTYSGVTTVTNGMLQLGDGTTRNGVVASTITVTSPGNLIYANPLPQTNSKAISGTGGFIKQAAGLLTLSVANTYSGATTITNGSTLRFGVANAIPSGAGKGDLSLLGTLDLNGFACGLNGLYGTGVVDQATSTASVTLTAGNGNANGNFTGLIKNSSGTVALTKAGTGTLEFGSTNTYSGITTISAGALQLDVDNALPSTTSVIVASNATFQLSSHNQTIGALSGQGTVDNLYGTLSVIGNAATTGVATQNFNNFSCIFGALNGGGTLVKDGTGAMGVRAPLSSFSGPITLLAGTLSAGAAPNVLPTSLSINVPSSALFQLDANSQAIASLSGNGAVNLGGGILTVASGTFNGVIQNSELPGSSTALGHGLRGYYYTNIDFTGLGAVRDDSTVNLTNMSALPNYSPSAKTNAISVRWLGQVLTTVAGDYVFTTTTDDGARLWVNGTLLVNSWASQGATARSGTLTLAANTKYDVLMEYFNNGGGGSALLSWTPPGDSTVPIPSSNLLLPGPGSLAVNGGLQLTGPSTYTGGSTVTSGTLEASSGAVGTGNVTVSDNATFQSDSATTINPAADVILSGNNSVVNLNFTGTNAVHGLSFDNGVSYAVPGVWGAIGSGAPHTSALFTGSGRLNVTANASINTLAASVSTAVYGSSVTLTSTITGFAGTPTGSVSFYDGANLLGTSPLVGNIATWSVNNLLVDGSPHSLTAVYSGDVHYAVSTSTPVSVTTTIATITPVPVVANKVYDTTTNATIASTTFTGILDSDTNYVHISTNYTANFSDPYVGTNKAVSITGIVMTGSLSDNYVLSTNAVNTTANITSKALYVTGLTATNKVYDSTTVDGVTGTAALSGVISPDSVALSGTATAAFTTKNSGTNKPVVLSGLSIPSTGIATNYALTLTNLSANITNFTVSITGVTANGKTYDGTTAATLSGTPTLTPAAFPGDFVDISGPPTAVFANAGAGLRGVTVTGYTLTNVDAANYTAVQPTGLSATIALVGTTATLSSSLNPSAPGTNVTFTYVVTAVSGTTTSPSGTVSFITNGFNSLPAIALVANGAGSAKATFTTSGLMLGTNQIGAQYIGDTNYSAPANASLQQVVQNNACSQTNKILGIVYNGGNSYTLTFLGTPSAQYYVIAQTNCGQPIINWKPVAGTTNTVTNANGNWSVTVTNPGPAFYLSRAVQPCP